MGLLTVINDEGHFQSEMAQAGVKLVVVDFTASWLGLKYLASSYICSTISNICVILGVGLVK